MMTRLVDLSHPIVMGMSTHPGLPGPAWEAFRSREDYRASSGTDFQVDRVSMVGNTGTYLDSPFHRFADGGDLASVPLAAVADVAVHVVASGGQRAVGADLLRRALADQDITGHAVLLHTGGDAGWGTERYAKRHRSSTAAGAAWLSERGRRSSGSTRSTSTTSPMRAVPPTRRCSAPPSTSWST